MYQSPKLFLPCYLHVCRRRQRHHKIAGAVSLGVDDDTARRWIANGPTELGWRVLAVRHGAAVIPEMLANLPSSFGEVHVLPPLAAMRFLNDAPASLADEIMKRLTGRMQPKAMEDVINALARVRPTGVPSIISLITAQPLGMPIYFVGKALSLLRDWEKENHLKIRVRSGLGDMSFAEWIMSVRLSQDRNDFFYRQTLAGERDLAVKLVVGPLRDDESAVKDIIGQVQPLTSYHGELYDLLIANPNLAGLALKAFSGAFDTFPEASLVRAVDVPGIEFDALLRALASACASTTCSPSAGVATWPRPTAITTARSFPIAPAIGSPTAPTSSGSQTSPISRSPVVSSTWRRSSTPGRVAWWAMRSAARSTPGSRSPRSKPPSGRATRPKGACIIPTAGRNTPRRSIASSLPITVSSGR